MFLCSLFFEQLEKKVRFALTFPPFLNFLIFFRLNIQLIYQLFGHINSLLIFLAKSWIFLQSLCSTKCWRFSLYNFILSLLGQYLFVFANWVLGNLWLIFWFWDNNLFILNLSLHGIYDGLGQFMYLRILLFVSNSITYQTLCLCKLLIHHWRLFSKTLLIWITGHQTWLTFVITGIKTLIFREICNILILFFCRNFFFLSLWWSSTHRLQKLSLFVFCRSFSYCIQRLLLVVLQAFFLGTRF